VASVESLGSGSVSANGPGSLNGIDVADTQRVITMYRLFTAGVLLLWISAMISLFMRDVWPSWSAQDAPPLLQESIEAITERQQQYGLFNEDSQRLGTGWSEITTTPTSSTIKGSAVIDSVPSIPTLPSIRIDTRTEFDADGLLDSFDLQLYGLPLTRIMARGERRGIYFPCELHVGPFHRQANLDMSATRMIGDSLRPFSFLPTLKVGQSWRMQVLDPISAALSSKTQFRSIVARVDRIETIRYAGQKIRCFVVVTSPTQTIAWVDPKGRVLVQEVELPGIGKIQVRQEPYEQGLRSKAQQGIPSWRYMTDDSVQVNKDKTKQ